MSKITTSPRQKESEVQLLLEDLGFKDPFLKYLLVLCPCRGDLNIFYKYFYSGNKRETFHEIMSYRTHLLKSRNFELNHFVRSYQRDQENAIEQLFLLPVTYGVFFEIKTHLMNGDFDLTDLYFAQLNSPELNPILLIKELCKY